MVNIAVIEDDKVQAAQLDTALRDYASEYKIPMKISIFHNAITFLDKYTGEFDIVFMDIMMPVLNGMDASRILREKDDHVMLIFVTSMQQFAIQGYEVGASDFIVKPVNYPEFKLKFTRMLRKLHKKDDTFILIKTDTGFIRLNPTQIIYVEVRAHHCVYHTVFGEYRQYQTMKSVESQLGSQGFVRCNNFLLINLAYVIKIDGMNVLVGDEQFQMSHPRRKEFTQRFADYSGGRHYE